MCLKLLNNSFILIHLWQWSCRIKRFIRSLNVLVFHLVTRHSNLTPWWYSSLSQCTANNSVNGCNSSCLSSLLNKMETSITDDMLTLKLVLNAYSKRRSLSPAWLTLIDCYKHDRSRDDCVAQLNMDVLSRQLRFARVRPYLNYGHFRFRVFLFVIRVQSAHTFESL